MAIIGLKASACDVGGCRRAGIFPSSLNTYTNVPYDTRTYNRMLGRCTSQWTMTIGTCAGVCPVTGAGAPALTPRSSITIHMYHALIQKCTTIILCRCTRAVDEGWEYVLVHARFPSAPPQCHVLTPCAVHIEVAYNNKCRVGAPDSGRC